MTPSRVVSRPSRCHHRWSHLPQLHMMRSPAPTLMEIMTSGAPHAGQLSFDMVTYSTRPTTLRRTRDGEVEASISEIPLNVGESAATSATDAQPVTLRGRRARSGEEQDHRGGVETDVSPDRGCEAPGALEEERGHDTEQEQAWELHELEV